MFPALCLLKRDRAHVQASSRSPGPHLHPVHHNDGPLGGRQSTVKELGERLFLDSGTLTPVLKKLEEKGYLTRERSKDDERNLIVNLTDKGLALRDDALSVPYSLASCVKLTREEAYTLYTLLRKLMYSDK